MKRTLWTVGFAIALLATTAPARADKCTGAKLKAIGKKESGLLRCQSKVAATDNTSGLFACETKVKGKFSTVFGKAGSCVGDEMACEDKADVCETNVASAMTETFPSRCESAKRKAAGKLASSELGCYSKAAAKGTALDSGCISKATGKFSTALGKAGTCPDGGSPQMLVENDCVQPAVTTDGGGMVTDVCPTTTTTTTLPGAACSLPATGQTTCWDSSGTVIACTGTGHDGDLRKGAPLAYVDNGDGTITDVNTGLVWEKQSSDGSVHDRSNGYTWDQAFSGHVATLNTMTFAGHSDWRVPNVRELQSIANYQNVTPAISPVFNMNCTAGCTVLTCSCMAPPRPPGSPSFAYWSSTTYAFSPSAAWYVTFFDGGVGVAVTTSFSFPVRGVRGGS